MARPLVAFFIATACALLVAVPLLAQTSDELESIREQRREAEAAAAAQAGEVDVVQAEVDELAAALDVLQARVNTQAGLVAEAERQLEASLLALDAAEAAVLEIEADLVALREGLTDSAISSFISNDQNATFLTSEDVSQAVRMQSLAGGVLQSEADFVEAIRVTEEDLSVERALAADLAVEAEQQRDALSAGLIELETARGEQAVLTAAAEDRLEQELGELASIQALDADLAAQEQAETDRLAEELRRRTAATNNNPSTNSGGGGAAPPTIVGSGEIVRVRGIQVHRSIASNVENMYAAAEADGIVLGGGGYRDSAGQIAVRKANCGTSNYAIYEMRASQCRPPTARPGTSQHEVGLAIDITVNGRIIRSRSSAAFQWLAANAASYGFYNLPSEPWHWSTTGR